MMIKESLIVRATVRTLKFVWDKSQRLLRSYILSSTKRKACSELSGVVEEPTIMPSAFAPLPATLFAVLVLPPSVPKSVTVKFGSALRVNRVQPRAAMTAKPILVCIFMGVWLLRDSGLQRSIPVSKNKNDFCGERIFLCAEILIL